MFDTYAEIFEKRAHEYHHAMKASPRARSAEFNAVLDPIRDAGPGLVCDMPSGGGYLADYLWPGMDYVAVDPATDFFVEWPTPRRRMVAEITMRPLRAMAHRDDVGATDKDRGLAVLDTVALEMRRARDHEQLIAENVDLRQLMRLQCIFDGQRMQAVLLGKCPQLSLGRLEKPHPDKLRFLVGARGGFVNRDWPYLAAITVEKCGDNAHRCLE